MDPVRRHLEDADHVVWVPWNTLASGAPDRCIDGGGEGRFGTPGGDAGELLLALGVIESAGESEVAAEAIEGAMAAYVEAFGPFYLHTDQAAMDRLGESLRADPLFVAERERGALAPEALQAWLRRPPAELQEALSVALSQPEHLGCAHLRGMLEHPSEYGVRPALVQAVLRAAFHRLWTHPASVDFAVLEAPSEEVAVLRVELSESIHPDMLVPTFPDGDGNTFSVSQPALSAFLRAGLVQRLAASIPSRGALEARELDAELAALATRQVEATLRHVSRDLPVYDVRQRGGILEVSGPNASLGCRNY